MVKTSRILAVKRRRSDGPTRTPHGLPALIELYLKLRYERMRREAGR